MLLLSDKINLPSLRVGRPKKVFILAVYFFEEYKSRSGGGARSLPGGAPRNLMVRISLLAHNFRGEDQNHRSSGRNLRLSLGVHSCFSSWNETLLKLEGAQAVFFFGGAQEPKCTPLGPDLLLSFGAQSLLGRHTSPVGGTNCDLGARPRNAPLPVALGLSHMAVVLSKSQLKYF